MKKKSPPNYYLIAAGVIVVFAGLLYTIFYTIHSENHSTYQAGGLTPPPPSYGTYRYDCDQNLRIALAPTSNLSLVHIQPMSASSILQPAILSRVSSQTGAVYKGGSIVLTSHGEQIDITKGKAIWHCTEAPDPDQTPLRLGN